MEKQTALEYNLQIQTRVNELCNPLFKTLGLSFFVYKKFIKNVGVVYICNNPSWAKFRHEQCLWECDIFKKEADVLAEDVPRFYPWCGKKPKTQDTLYDALYHKNIWNGVSRYMRKSNEIEAIGFGTTRDKLLCPAFYLEHAGILEKFITYFKQQCLDVLSGDNALVPLETQNIWGSLGMHPDTQVFEGGAKYYFILDREKKLVRLTPRESDIAPYLSRGYTAKDIAYKLDLSSRTVESYISNIKMKTGLHFKSEIVAALNAVAV